MRLALTVTYFSSKCNSKTVRAKKNDNSLNSVLNSTACVFNTT